MWVDTESFAPFHIILTFDTCGKHSTPNYFPGGGTWTLKRKTLNTTNTNVGHHYRKFVDTLPSVDAGKHL